MLGNAGKVEAMSTQVESGWLSHMKRFVHAARARAGRFTTAGFCRLKAKVASESGQGTVEYAILVGVLVVIAILAILAFRGNLQSLWDGITSGFEKLHTQSS